MSKYVRGIGYEPFALAFREATRGSTGPECAAALGLQSTTVYQIRSADIRPGAATMQVILRKYPELYDLAMESYFGPRPEEKVIPQATQNPLRFKPDGYALHFGEMFKRLQRDRTTTEYAAFLGISHPTVYRLWHPPTPPDINLLQRIVAKLPQLYDLAAAVHFGPRPMPAAAPEPVPA